MDKQMNYDDPSVLECITLTVELTREEDTPNQWTSRCVELDIISAENSPHRAFEAVAEAVRMYVDDCVQHRNETPVEALQGYMHRKSNQIYVFRYGDPVRVISGDYAGWIGVTVPLYDTDPNGSQRVKLGTNGGSLLFPNDWLEVCWHDHSRPNK